MMVAISPRQITLKLTGTIRTDIAKPVPRFEPCPVEQIVRLGSGSTVPVIGTALGVGDGHDDQAMRLVTENDAKRIAV